MTEQPSYAHLTGTILECCFEVMRELGAGFLESVYGNAIVIALEQRGLKVETEKAFEIYFRQQKIGRYIADVVVNDTAIIELKCCKALSGEHLAQTINYLSAANLPVGLVVNFRRRNLEYKRVYHPLLSCRRVCADPTRAADLVAEGDPVFDL